MSTLRPTNPPDEGVLIYLPPGCRAIIEFPLGQGPFAAPRPDARAQVAVHAGKDVQETQLQNINWVDLRDKFVNMFEHLDIRPRISSA